MKMKIVNYLTASFFFIANTPLLAAQQSKSVITLTDSNYEVVFLNRSSTVNENELNNAKSQYAFEALNTKYDITTSLDVSQQKDQTESTSTFLKQDSDLSKLTWLTTKRFTSGTLLGLEYTEQHPTVRTNPATTSTSYYQKYFTVSAEQNLFPFIADQNELAAYKANQLDLQGTQLQNKLNLISAINDFSNLFWSTLTLKKSIEENQKILLQYEKLVKTVRGKSNFNYANAGELEQALAEYETRIQNLQSDKNQLTENINKIRIKLLMDENTMLELKFENTAPTPPIKVQLDRVEETAQYKIQKLKKESADEALKSLSYTNAPQLSVYGKYTQSGADGSSSEASSKMTNSDYQKYIIGLKLDYTFGNEKNVQDQIIKVKTAQIESEKNSVSLNQIKNEYQQLVEKVNNLSSQIESQKKIIELRQKASEQLYKNYSQGRTDISNLIDAYNRKITAELQLMKNYSDYFQAQILLRNYSVK